MKIFILLTDTGTLFTRAIKLYTRKPYNHTSISFDGELTEVYSFGRKMPNNPFTGGFVKEEVENELFKNARCAVYSCHVTEEQYEKMLKKVQEMEAKKELYRYNLIGVFALAAKMKVKRKNAYFCSQFVAALLQEAEIYIANKPLFFITPHDIQSDSRLQLEYEGDLKNYL